METPRPDSGISAATLDDVVAELNRCRQLLERIDHDQTKVRYCVQYGLRARPGFFAVFWPVSFALALGVPIVWFSLMCLVALLLGGTAAVAAFVSGILDFIGSVP